MQTEIASLTEFYGPIISSYTRAQAIEDGLLVPISKTLLSDAGITYPVCVTDTIWNGYIDLYDLSKIPGQSVEGRLWDLVWMLYVSIKSGSGRSDRIRYTVLFQMEPRGEPEEIELIAVCGPGDAGEPVITVMLPGED